jgi:DNA-binding NtrC family response regulator
VSTILIIDDEAHIRKFVAVNLYARGYEALEAGDVEHGLRLLRDHTPALVLLDLKLPGAEGWAFLDAMNADPSLPRSPVVMLTGTMLLDQSYREQYPTLIDVLVKPLSVEDLMAVVARVG